MRKRITLSGMAYDRQVIDLDDGIHEYPHPDAWVWARADQEIDDDELITEIADDPSDTRFIWPHDAVKYINKGDRVLVRGLTYGESRNSKRTIGKSVVAYPYEAIFLGWTHLQSGQTVFDDYTAYFEQESRVEVMALEPLDGTARYRAIEHATTDQVELR